MPHGCGTGERRSDLVGVEQGAGPGRSRWATLERLQVRPGGPGQPCRAGRHRSVPVGGDPGRYPGLSERTVRTCLDRLEAEGIISPCDPVIIAARIKRADWRRLGLGPGPCPGPRRPGSGQRPCTGRPKPAQPGARPAPRSAPEPHQHPGPEGGDQVIPYPSIGQFPTRRPGPAGPPVDDRRCQPDHQSKDQGAE